MGHRAGWAGVPQRYKQYLSVPVPLLVIGGFLGAGKTTLLNHLLARPHGQRLAVLVNDFGALNVDASLIAAHDGETISFANGCVCCTLGDNFMLTVDTLLEREPLPDMIVVEASGVADPANIAAVATLEPRLARELVVVLADAETVKARANDARLADTLQRQLRSADLVVLNKADLVSEAVGRATAEWLREGWERPVLTVSNADVPLDALLDAPAARQARCPATSTDSVSHPFVTERLDITDRPTLAALREVLVQLGPDVLRAKGVVDTAEGAMLVQRVGPRVTLTHAPGTKATGLVVLRLAVGANEMLET